MKNEGPYLIEWLAHHRCMGVQDFFIAANDNDDINMRLFEALAELGYINLLVTPTREGIKPQMPAYASLLQHFGEEVHWMAFIDADEFIWPTSPMNDLPDFVGRFHPDRAVGAIALNWATYGSSRKVWHDDQPVCERFDWRAVDEFEANHHIKSIVRPAAVSQHVNPHYVQLRPGFEYVHTDGSPYKRKARFFEKTPADLGLSERRCWDFFRVNHYVIKSWSEYTETKTRRGRATSPNEGLNHDAFFFHDRNEVHDPAPESHLKAIRCESEKIRSKLLTKGIDEQVFASMREPLPKSLTPGIINGVVEHVSLIGDELQIKGWGLAWRDNRLDQFGVWVNGTLAPILRVLNLPRNDVQLHFPSAPLHAGFQLSLNRAHLPPVIYDLKVQASIDGIDASILPFGPAFDIETLCQAMTAPPSMPGHIDCLRRCDRELEIEGWGLMNEDQIFSHFEVRTNELTLSLCSFVRLNRPDVQALYPNAPIEVGFRLRVLEPPESATPSLLEVYGVTNEQKAYRIAHEELSFLPLNSH